MGLFQSLLLLTILLSLTYFIISSKPDFFFWLSLLLFFDPGGIFENYFGSKIIGVFNASDFFFFFMTLAFLSIKNKPNFIKEDHNFKRIFRYLLFVGFYYIFIYGLIIPLLYQRENFLFFLQKNRLYIFAFPMMYFVYFFSQRSIDVFFKVLVSTAVILLTLYFFTLITGIEIIPVYEIERFKGTGIMRKVMLSYGLIYWIVYLAIIIYYIRKKVNFSLKINLIFIYFAAILMAVSILITLTRRELVTLIALPLAIIFLISFIFRVSKVINLSKVVVPIIIVIIALFIIIPEYFDYVVETYNDIIYQITPSDSPGAEKDYRVTGESDLKYVFIIIKENPFFGTGAITMLWSDVVFAKQMGDIQAIAIDAAGEVPFYGVWMHFGIIGGMFLLIVYFLLIKFVIGTIKFLRNYVYEIVYKNAIELIILIFLIADIITRFTVGFFSLFGEFFAGHLMVNFCISLGFLYSLSYKLKKSKNVMYD